VWKGAPVTTVLPETATADEKKKLVQHLGLRIAAGINAAAPLAPTGLAAAVLLSHDRRALSETEILDRAEFLHTAALDSGAHRGAEPIRPLVANAVESLCADGTLKRHEAGGERFYAVPEERRIALDYHKNGILHFLVAPAILSAALRSFRGQAAPHAELLRRARDVSRLVKYEFIFPPGKSLESTVDETFALLLRWGLVERAGDAVQPVARGVRRRALRPAACRRRRAASRRPRGGAARGTTSRGSGTGSRERRRRGRGRAASVRAPGGHRARSRSGSARTSCRFRGARTRRGSGPPRRRPA